MNKLRHLFTLLVIIYMTGINVMPNRSISLSSLDVVEGNSVTQIIGAAIYLIVIIFLIARLKFAFRLSTNNLLIWLLMAWVLVSLLWSAEASLTLRRALSLIGTTLIGLYIATYYELDQLMKVACWSFLVIGLVSLAVIFLVPAWGIMSDPYGWKGIFYHKNGLGMFGLFGITLCPAFIRSKIARVPWRTVFGLCCLLVVGSNSMTAMLLSAAAVFLWLCVFTYRSRFYAGFIALTISSMIATAVGIWMYLSGNIVALFGLLGKDATLTGRTLLWKLALYAVRQNPWIGYGYRAFWLGKDYGPAAEYMGHYASYLSSSHNGYIDLLLDTGVVGAVLVVLVFAVIFRRLLVNLASSVSRDPYLLWPLVFLVILLLRNFVEADLLVQNNLAWVFVAAFGFYEIRKKTMASVVYKPYFVSPPPELHPAPRTSARRTESGGATTV